MRDDIEGKADHFGGEFSYRRNAIFLIKKTTHESSRLLRETLFVRKLRKLNFVVDFVENRFQDAFLICADD